MRGSIQRRWRRGEGSEAGFALYRRALSVVKQDHINVLEDIREWTKYPDWGMYSIAPGTVKVLWASPPCQHYSRAHTVGERNLELADDLVKCALLAIEYLKPIYWFVENPVGLLKDRPFMQEFRQAMETVSYCSYGAQYRKNTNVWSNAWSCIGVVKAPLLLHAIQSRSLEFTTSLRKLDPLETEPKAQGEQGLAGDS